MTRGKAFLEARFDIESFLKPPFTEKGKKNKWIKNKNDWQGLEKFICWYFGFKDVIEYDFIFEEDRKPKLFCQLDAEIKLMNTN